MQSSSPTILSKLSRAFTVVVFSLVCILPHAVSASICEAELKTAFKKIEKPGKTVKTTSFVNYAGNDTGGSTTDSAESWTAFNECNGNLVIHADGSCLIQTVYTTGSCAIKGMPKY